MVSLLGLETQTEEVLATVRCVLAASGDCNTPFTLAAIAERTGLTLEAVEFVLNSPIYKQLFYEQAHHLLIHSLTRAIKRMDAIVHGDVVKNSDRISAASAIGRLYEVAAKRAPQKEPESPDLGNWAHRNSIPTTNRITT